MVLIYSPDYDQHQDPFHIENNSRTNAILDALAEKKYLENINVLEPGKASENDILRVHTPEHVDYIREFCSRGGGNIDYDTYATPASYDVGLLAAGGAITAVKSVLDTKNTWAYSIARPPGHHATSQQAMGFCLFNNIAVAVAYLLEVRGLERILIFDFDVHFGNGTSQIFYQDPRVLYISIHQDPRTIFPGTGFIDELGQGPGKGYNINIPMAPGSGNRDYIWILKEILGKIVSEFQPQILLADVGFDAHAQDPLSRCKVDEDFYSWVGEYLMDLQGAMALFLEGGYHLKALASSNLCLINAMENGRFSPAEYRSRAEIEKEYIETGVVSRTTKSTREMLRNNLSPYFQI